jgi:DNA-binding NarL/FixJ family response regulator
MEPLEATGRIRLLIVEDHTAVRAGIRTLLKAAADIEVVGEAADGAQAVDLANQYAPDFILLDMELPILRGDEVLRRVLQRRPDVRVLVLSSYDDPSYIKAMLASGARGYLLKEEAPSLLLTAIRSIDAQSAGAWLSPRISQSVVLPAFEQALSWRELAILEYLLEGQSRAEIASALNLSNEQLERHVQLLMQKFEATSLNALLEIARRLLPPEY